MRATLLCAVGVAIFCALPFAAPAATAPSRSDTVWFFDADFEDLEGDNAGWTSRDMSGEPGGPNYWHRDTVRTAAHTADWDLGDSCWWCGTYDALGCWKQSRGYGNDWMQSLWREFPEIAANTAPGDQVKLQFNTRWALESRYDYGYVEISEDAGSTWTRLAYYANNGWPGTPGPSVNWYVSGVKTIDLSAYAGEPVTVRFRVDSNAYGSSQDEYDDSYHSYRDGAWMLDNLTLKKNGVQFWYDDCESFGDNGWVSSPMEPHGQTGVAFSRTLESVVDPARWMMSAYAESTGLTVDDESAWLMSPPIDISGVAAGGLIVVTWSGWMDLPGIDTTGAYIRDQLRVALHQAGDSDCLWDSGSVTTYGYMYSADPAYVTFSGALVPDDGANWLGVRLRLEDTHQYEAAGHGRGYMLDRLRVGAPVTTSVPGDAVLSGIGVLRPNPSEGETSIAYTASGPGEVTLRVYDLTGRVIRTLVDGPVEPGEREATWDGLTDSGARAASGVYFVKLLGVDGLAGEAKLVLLK